jgi:hypothetical protein
VPSSALVPQSGTQMQIENNIIINIRCVLKDGVEVERFAIDIKFANKFKLHIT